MIRLLAGVFSFLAISGIAAIGGVGLVVWMYSRDLPSHESLAAYAPATLSRVFSGEGDLIAEFARERRIFVPSDEIPDMVKKAFVAAEDQHFYSHGGLDFTGIARAAVANLEAMRRGSTQLQGGSTITQQVMKNFLLTSDRSIERKIKEAILSVRIEQAMSKDRILELYLNEIFLGQNAYGVAAAAQRYFGKTLENLTLAEAAYLAALPQAPSVLHPIRQHDRAVARRNYVLRQMLDNGFVTQEQHDAAAAQPLATVLDESIAAQIATPAPMDHFSEEVRRQMVGALGETAVFEGGLTIHATIDPRMQQAAAAALRRQLEDYDRNLGYRGPVAQLDDFDPADTEGWRAALSAVEAPRDIPGWRLGVVLSVGEREALVGFEDGQGGIPFSDVRGWARRPDGAAPRRPSDVFAPGDVIQAMAVLAADGRTVQHWSLRQVPAVEGAFMAMDVETGRVLAMQGGFSYGNSVFNRATQALRQPGSSFKPFVYAAALDRGYTPSTVILDAPVTVDTGAGLWRPQNSSGRYYGPAPMRIGLEMSRNLMTIRLAQEIGMETVAEYAERFGVYHDMPPLLSYSLGAGETTLSQMVSAYAMFANGGRQITPTLVDRVQDRRGRTIWKHNAQLCESCRAADPRRLPDPVQAGSTIMDPVTAFQITSMLRGVTTRGTAARPFANVPVPVAGKTGTTNDARDVWFVGFTPRIAAGCYIGYDEPKPLGRNAFGGTLCAPAVAEFFKAVYETRAPGQFEEPDGVMHVAVNRWSGRPGGGPDAIDEVFRIGQGPDTAPGAVIGSEDDSFYFGGAVSALEEGPAEGPAQTVAQPVTVPRAADGFGSPGGLY